MPLYWNVSLNFACRIYDVFNDEIYTPCISQISHEWYGNQKY